jgi:hypothetical protein
VKRKTRECGKAKPKSRSCGMLVIFWWLSEMADKKSEYCLTMLKKFTFAVSKILSKSIEQPLYEL